MGNQCTNNSDKINPVDISNVYQDIVKLFLPTWYQENISISDNDYNNVLSIWNFLCDEENIVSNFNRKKYYFSEKSDISDLTDGTVLTQILDYFFYEFYFNLFEEYPEFKPLFRNDMDIQGRKLVAMMNTLIRNMQYKKDEVTVVVKRLVIIHSKFGVKPNHYCFMMNALIRTLKQVLGEELYTHEIDRSWKRIISNLLSLLLPIAVHEDLRIRYKT